MHCRSCDTVVASTGRYAVCVTCAKRIEGTDAGTDAESGVLLPDGGKEQENEGEYISPDEIVGEDLTDDTTAETDDGTQVGTDNDTAAGTDDSTRTGTDDEGSEKQESDGEPAFAESTSEPSASSGGISQEAQSTDSHQSQGSRVGRYQQSGQAGSRQQQGRQSAGQGGPQHTKSGSEVLDQLRAFPLKLGAALGAVAFLVPYLLLTIAASWVYDESPVADPEMGAFDVGAEVFLTIAGLGSGERVVDLFIGMADVGVTSPGEVDPSNYPTVESQLEAILPLLDSNPEVPLLLLYLIAPYSLFVSGRYLARHYAPRETMLDRVLAGATVALGTLPVVLFVGIAFETFALLERIVFVGLFLPAGFGALGGLSISFFDERSAMVSTLFGWGAIAVGVGIAAMLLPLPDLGLGEDAGLALSFLDRLVVGLGAYLNVLEFNMGAHMQGRLFFLLVALVTVAAGFLRTWRVEEPVENRMAGALLGASIWLGFFATVAVFLWVFPMSTALVDVFVTGDGLTLVSGIEGDAIEGAGSVTIPTIEAVVSVDSYFHTIAVSGFVFPAMFGGIGGYLAVWYNERS